VSWMRYVAYNRGDLLRGLRPRPAGRRARERPLSTLRTVEFGVLGPLQVRDAGNEVEVRRGHPRALLTALLLHVGETVSRDLLAELLWRDDQPQHPTNALQVQVSHLRKTLKSDRPLIETRPGGYCLVANLEDIDAYRFEQLVREADIAALDEAPGALESALECLDAALGLWRGEALADVAGEDFAHGEITRLTELRWVAIEKRTDVLLELGRHRELVGELAALVSSQPLRERFHEQLIVALYRCGRQADALRAFENARQTLLEELGIDPRASLQELERQVLEQDPSLEWAEPAFAQSSEAVGRSPALPVPLTSLIGRGAELARAEALIESNRLVTLTGPGGAGKSRLALEIAQRAISVWFVDLGSVVEEDRVATTAAAAIGVPISPDDDPSAAVADALARSAGLLVLDTCEHVLNGVGELAIRVLRQCPDVRLLATSRRPLGITGEIAWPVPPLPLPPPERRHAADVIKYPAVALFAERAAAVRPGFEVTDATSADIVAICAGLDGLPLAIELAAARTDVLTPAAINARLQNRFDLLVDGGREAAARQQTLRAAIDWSFELLSPDQRRFFTRLSVFAGSFDLDAAVAVAGDGLADPLGLLSALVRSSMVSVSVVGDDRYRLLDTLRAYALSALDEEEDALRRAHAVRYTAVAEEVEQHIVGADQLEWLAGARADVPNFRAAFEWSVTNGEMELGARLAGALSWFWTLDGMLAEAVEYLERVAPMVAIPPLVRSKVLSGLALLAASLGRVEQARTAAAESVSLSRDAGGLPIQVFALNVLAVVEWARGNLLASAAAHDKAITYLAQANEPWLLGVCLALRARTALDCGDPNGEEMAEASLIAARASGDRHVIGLALLQIAQLRLSQGNVDAAIAAASESLFLQEEIAYTEGIVASLHVLARSREAAGDLEPAEELDLRALELADRIGHAGAVCEALEGLASIAVSREEFDRAARILGAAAAERNAHGLPLREADRPAIENLQRAARAGAASTDQTPSEKAVEPLLAELLEGR
jgi:predicted ATPase/DNA-binding SARP family transcriptional activator